MMKRALILQHVDDDSFGRFGDILDENAIAYDIIALQRGDTIPGDAMSRYDLLMPMGGAMQVWEEDQYPWLIEEKAFIRDWVVARGKPYLGICLGHQLLVAALGGEVGNSPIGEVGVFDVELDAGRDHPFLEGLETSQQITQWHYAEALKTPDCLAVLAASPATPVQMVAYGKTALATQFHMEWTLSSMQAWQRFPSWIAELEKCLGQGAHGRLMKQAENIMPAMDSLARRLFNNFKRQSGLVAAAEIEPASPRNRDIFITPVQKLT